MGCALAAAWLAVAPSAVLAQQDADEPTVRQAIQSVIEMDAWRDTARLPRVTLDPVSGDLTVVFAMRRPITDDPAQIVASATDDVFSILWATYTSAAAARVRTTTVLGTYAVVGRYERAREIPLLRAVLSAGRAVNFDWSNANRLDPREVLDTWWVESELTRN